MKQKHLYTVVNTSYTPKRRAKLPHARHREYTYTLMTSGNVDDLIKGVVILHGIEGLVMNGKSFPTDSETAAGPR